MIYLPTDLELWLRTDCPYTDRRREVVIDRLDDLIDAGRIGDVTIRTWSREVPLSTGPPDAGDDRHEVVRERVRAFHEWARSEGISLPAFSRTRARCGRMGPEVTHQILPEMALAAYADGDLCWVVPHADGDDRYTVLDALDRLAGDGGDAPTVPTPDVRRRPI